LCSRIWGLDFFAAGFALRTVEVGERVEGFLESVLGLVAVGLEAA
jgi:hypothetical protein